MPRPRRDSKLASFLPPLSPLPTYISNGNKSAKIPEIYARPGSFVAIVPRNEKEDSLKLERVATFKNVVAKEGEEEEFFDLRFFLRILGCG